MNADEVRTWWPLAIAGAEVAIRELCWAIRRIRDEDEALFEQLATELAQQLAAAREVTSSPTNVQLDAAFAALRAAGILALHHAATTTASAQKRIRTLGSDARGAVFYSEADLAAALAGKPLRMSVVGIGEDSDERRHAIATEVVAALTAAGLAPTWSGKPRDRISLPPFAWSRARHDAAPPLTPRAVMRIATAYVSAPREHRCDPPDLLDMYDAEAGVGDRVCDATGEVIEEYLAPWVGDLR